MKKPVSLKLSHEMAERVQALATASKLKKNTVVEMCIEMHLPSLEKRYEKEIAELLAREAEDHKAAVKSPNMGGGRLKKKTYPSHAAQGSSMNESKS